MSIWSAIALSVLATCCYQIGMVMQKIGADRMPRLALTLRQSGVYRAFLGSRIWLGGVLIMIAGWVIFLKAIANAPVSIVQPVLGFGLVILAVFSVVFLHERLRAMEWCGVALMVVGIVFLGISGSGQAHAKGTVSPPALIAVSAVLLASLGASVPLARAGRAVSLPMVLGFGAGVLIGLGALYARALFVSLDAGSRPFALACIPLMIIANVAGIWVQQAGFQQGRALIVVAMNAVTNKVVTIVGGMVTLGELLPPDAGLAAARIAGFVTVLLGTVVLARFAGEGLAAQQSAAVAGAIPKPVVRAATRGVR